MITNEQLRDEARTWSEKIGLKPKEIQVREMKRKWASCSTRGRVTLSSSLLGEPKKKRDKVIVHELLHLRYPNHGKMFHMMLRSYLGDTHNMSKIS